LLESLASDLADDFGENSKSTFNVKI
jgi:hypothetical protein